MKYIIPNFGKGKVDPSSQAKIDKTYKEKCAELDNFVIKQDNTITRRPPVTAGNLTKAKDGPRLENIIDIQRIGDHIAVLRQPTHTEIAADWNSVVKQNIFMTEFWKLGQRDPNISTFETSAATSIDDDDPIRLDVDNDRSFLRDANMLTPTVGFEAGVAATGTQYSYRLGLKNTVYCLDIYNEDGAFAKETYAFILHQHQLGSIQSVGNISGNTQLQSLQNRLTGATFAGVMNRLVTTLSANYRPSAILLTADDGLAQMEIYGVYKGYLDTDSTLAELTYTRPYPSRQCWEEDMHSAYLKFYSNRPRPFLVGRDISDITKAPVFSDVANDLRFNFMGITYRWNRSRGLHALNSAALNPTVEGTRLPQDINTFPANRSLHNLRDIPMIAITMRPNRNLTGELADPTDPNSGLVYQSIAEESTIRVIGSTGHFPITQWRGTLREDDFVSNIYNNNNMGITIYRGLDTFLANRPEYATAISRCKPCISQTQAAFDTTAGRTERAMSAQANLDATLLPDFKILPEVGDYNGVGELLGTATIEGTSVNIFNTNNTIPSGAYRGPTEVKWWPADAARKTVTDDTAGTLGEPSVAAQAIPYIAYGGYLKTNIKHDADELSRLPESPFPSGNGLSLGAPGVLLVAQSDNKELKFDTGITRAVVNQLGHITSGSVGRTEEAVYLVYDYASPEARAYFDDKDMIVFNNSKGDRYSVDILCKESITDLPFRSDASLNFINSILYRMEWFYDTTVTPRRQVMNLPFPFTRYIYERYVSYYRNTTNRLIKRDLENAAGQLSIDTINRRARLEAHRGYYGKSARLLDPDHTSLENDTTIDEPGYALKNKLDYLRESDNRPGNIERLFLNTLRPLEEAGVFSYEPAIYQLIQSKPLPAGARTALADRNTLHLSQQHDINLNQTPEYSAPIAQYMAPEDKAKTATVLALSNLRASDVVVNDFGPRTIDLTNDRSTPETIISTIVSSPDRMLVATDSSVYSISDLQNTAIDPIVSRISNTGIGTDLYQQSISFIGAKDNRLIALRYSQEADRFLTTILNHETLDVKGRFTELVSLFEKHRLLLTVKENTDGTPSNEVWAFSLMNDSTLRGISRLILPKPIRKIRYLDVDKVSILFADSTIGEMDFETNDLPKFIDDPKDTSDTPRRILNPARTDYTDRVLNTEGSIVPSTYKSIIRALPVLDLETRVEASPQSRSTISRITLGMHGYLNFNITIDNVNKQNQRTQNVKVISDRDPERSNEVQYYAGLLPINSITDNGGAAPQFGIEKDDDQALTLSSVILTVR